ncbi:glycosyl hydrolase [Paenibacillus vietnamensis]|uniref:glycosyl hydrolase n=1 Tax=Paenibacillus vietnamensis TaxID=2590547 RepID=UPI001CD0B561|nr:glycosyl hydrolase [Paenibacillus vietnamensis]
MNMTERSFRFDVDPTLVNPNAEDNAKRLMTYLCDIYGKRTLTGQQIGVLSAPEMTIIREVTGHYPAVYGFDFMNYSPSRTERGSTCSDTDIAIDWWNGGGIVTFCWHWNAPKDLLDIPPERSWSRGFYTEATSFDVKKAMDDPDSEEYRLILRDIDAIAVQLRRLQTAGVPVLWRPLHEASGGWFWWGARGAEPCVRLWKLMYDRMTNLHKLNHLIWVWNGQHADWYPGDEYVDIIGEDIYPPKKNYDSQYERFQAALSYTGRKKIVALTENGPLPDPDLMLADGALWSWSCTWYGDFVYVTDDEGNRTYSGEYTEREQLIKFYRHPFTLTKDELPDLKNYPIR